MPKGPDVTALRYFFKSPGVSMMQIFSERQVVTGEILFGRRLLGLAAESGPSYSSIFEGLPAAFIFDDLILLSGLSLLGFEVFDNARLQNGGLMLDSECKENNITTE
jgi:hypothetical protein